jgi:HSP20 family protein
MSETAMQTNQGDELARTAEAPRGVTVLPRVDILETDDELLLLADLPGVQPQDVDVRFENGELALHGRRHPRYPDKQRVRWEAEVANYYRAFRVTEHIAGDRIAAELKDGVLTVHLPKVEAVKPRRIAVKGE